MKIGIIGPNILYKPTEQQLEERQNNLTKVAKIIAPLGHEIVLTPDKKSLLEFFGEKYLENDGEKVWIVAPMNDDAEKYLNLKLGEIINCDNWTKQPSSFNLETDILVCVGYSGGVLSEIGASRHYKPKKIIILNEFISAPLPSEIYADITYCSIEDLQDVLKNLKIK